MHLLKMFGLLFSGIASIWMPFADSLNFLKNIKIFKKERSRNILLGIILSVPLLIIITALLSSADLLFGKMTKDMFDFVFSSRIINIAFMILFGALSCYCIVCGAVRRTKLTGDELIEKKADPAIAITVMSLIGIIYLVFCSIQVVYLFANGLFALPEEFTLAVTVINITLILICTSAFRKNRILNGILTVITIGTYIMIASATYRMLLYIGAYHLTFLRLFVLLFLLIDALVLAGVIIFVYHRKFPLFGYCIAVGTVCYLAFSFGKPDYYIADYFLAQESQFKFEDFTYLTAGLSLDAAPAVLPFLADSESYAEIHSQTIEGQKHNSWAVSASYASEYYDRISRAAKENGIRDFNLSAKIASDYARRYPLKQTQRE